MDHGLELMFPIQEILEIDVVIFPRILEILEISVFQFSTILEILEISVFQLSWQVCPCFFFRGCSKIPGMSIAVFGPPTGITHKSDYYFVWAIFWIFN